MVQPQTAKLGAASLDLFEAWLGRVGISTPLQTLAAAPVLLDAALESFGRMLWDSGRPLYLLLHAITALQRRWPTLRRSLPSSWQTVTIWETEEPLQHRVPLPWPIAGHDRRSSVC